MNKALLRNKIEDILISNYKRTNKFSPSYISDLLNLDLANTIILLENIVESGLLDKVFIVRCEYCHYNFEYDDYNKIPFGQYKECGMGHEVYIENDNVQVWYKPNKDNIKELKDYKKKH